MARTILIEVQVEEIDSIEPGYSYDPKIAYELTPTDGTVDGSFEFVCRKSQLESTLRRLDHSHKIVANRVSTKAIYAEPEEKAGKLLRDAAHKMLTGFNIPALDVIVDSIEEAVMPDRVRQRNIENKEGEK